MSDEQLDQILHDVDGMHKQSIADQRNTFELHQKVWDKVMAQAEDNKRWPEAS